MLRIKYLDKAAVLLALWQRARYLPHIFSLEDKPTATYLICQQTIRHMNGAVKLTTYYGKRIAIDLTGPQCDTTAYDREHGKHQARDAIQELQAEQIKQCVIVFYKHS